MDMELIEGALLEAPTDDARAVDRRAFGEFVGENGELASYALGWTSTERFGRITVGIGAGNPAGGTFHARVSADADGVGFELVDETFEEVAQGGRHLSVSEALEHEDIAFIWMVVDLVCAHDRRGQWLIHFLKGTPAIQMPPVLDGREPVLIVANDDGDYWQLIGATDPGPDGTIGHLCHAIDRDATLLNVLDLKPGEAAERQFVGDEWIRTPIPREG